MDILSPFLLQHIAIFILLLTSFTYGVSKTKEHQLIEKLLLGYQKDARPTEENQRINVTFGLELVNLLSVDEREQVIETRVWVRQRWYNKYLTWKPSDYGNITQLEIDSDLLWIPDILLYNSADGGGEEDEDESTFPGGTWKYKTKITLRNDGTNIWNSPATFKTVCAIDITDFPYDKQLCVMTYGSWAMDLGDIDIQPDNNPVLTSQFIENSQWAVTKSEKVREELKTDCCINPFILIKINLLLERKPAYYNLNILAPCVLLQLVNLCGFFLPPESGENIGLTITVLLAVAVFLQMVSLTLPRSSDNLPTVGVFFMVVMIESVLILLVTCLILILYKNSNDVYAPRVSPWIKSFVINKLGRLVGINKFKENKKKLGFGVSTPGNVSKVYKEGNVSEADFSMNGSGNFRDLPPSLTDSETGSKEQKFWQPRRKALVAILDQVVKIREKITQEEPVGEEDWYILMTVVNRLFCYFFVLMTICTLIGLFEVAF